MGDLRPGDHACLFYETEEEKRNIIAPFLCRGLKQGEKVICIVNGDNAEPILDHLRAEGINVKAYSEQGQLSILKESDAYTRKGFFNPEQMIAFLQEEAERALKKGYSALRITSEMTWVLRGPPGPEKLIEYEAKLSGFFPGSRCLAICRYDCRRFDASTLLDVLCTHPIAIISTEVYENCFYIPPDELLKEDRAAMELRHWVKTIAERGGVEKKLIDSARFLKAVLDSVQDGISVLNPDLTIRYTNSAIKRWHAKHLPLEGKPCYVCYQDANRPCNPCPSLRCMKTGKVEREVKRLPPYSPVKWIELFSYPLRDLVSKEITGVVEFVRDITARKEAEAERDRLAVAIEQAGEAIVITDPNGTIQYVNPAFEAITGYHREEAIGQNPRILKSGEHDEAFYKDLWNTITRGQTWQGRFINRRKDGTIYYEDATISPVKNSSGKILNYVAAKRDVTGHLKVYQEKALLQEQLHEAQKLESIGRLAGGIAHDFNNMLNVILGYGEIILGRLHPEDPIRKDVEKILDAGRRSAALTGQLLAFSRKQTLQPKVVNLNEHLPGIKETLQRLIGEDIDLQLILSDDLAPVLVDPMQFDQVIMNLAVNARDAMPKGGKLLIETKNVWIDEEYAKKHQGIEPGEYVLLSVTDTGCGMVKETLSHIFEPFFTTKKRGTGLGLSMVYGMVKQLKGHIWAYSEPGQGTIFKIYLPKAQDSTEELSLPARAKNKRGDVVVGHGRQVLVVEDEESLRELIKEMLSSLGFQVHVAANGGEALLLVEEESLKLDLIITDVVMPGMSGDVMVERFRKHLADLKVLYMSGYTDNAIVHHGVLEPGTLFMQKPFSLEDLAKKVKSALGNKGE